MKNSFKLNYSIATNKGIKPINEDACYIGFNETKQCLAIICDGIGSQDDSQIASLITIETFANSFKKYKKIHNIQKWFEKNLNDSYEAITASSNKNLGGKKIGTTILLCLITNDEVKIFNLGDTRLYHYFFNENQWETITKDHNLYNYLIDSYEKDKSIKINDLLLKYKSQLFSLTKCLESNSNVHEDYSVYSVKLKPGDLLFLASDGIYHYIKLSDVNECIKKLSNRFFENISNNLIRLALNNNSNDNLTSIVIEYINNV